MSEIRVLNKEVTEVQNLINHLLFPTIVATMVKQDVYSIFINTLVYYSTTTSYLGSVKIILVKLWFLNCWLFVGVLLLRTL